MTNRDAWAYNFSREELLANMRRMVDFYNSQLADFDKWLARTSRPRDDESVDAFIERDATKISWTRGLKSDLRKGKKAKFEEGRAVQSMYRPYCRNWLYFDRQMNEMVLLVPQLFPTAEATNLVISLNAADARKPFGALIVDVVPNLALSDPGQCFPLYYYEAASDSEGALFGTETEGGFVRRDAITDQTLAAYRDRYGEKVQKIDIFYYVYGILHSPEYKERFVADLKKVIPRIPMVDAFWELSHAGHQLADCHLNYETIEPWPLEERVLSLGEPDLRVTKMRFPKSGTGVDKTTIVCNSSLSLGDIPLDAYRYDVNGKSAIEWIMDRYQIKTDNASGIVNDPNAWSEEAGNPRYIVDLVKRMVSVSMRTNEILSSLPKLALGSKRTAVER